MKETSEIKPYKKTKRSAKGLAAQITESGNISCKIKLTDAEIGDLVDIVIDNTLTQRQDAAESVALPEYVYCLQIQITNGDGKDAQDILTFNDRKLMNYKLAELFDNGAERVIVSKVKRNI